MFEPIAARLCKGWERMPHNFDVRTAFLEEARMQGLEYKETTPDGRIVIAMEDGELTVNLENIAREIARKQDPAAMKRFVTTIRESLADLPAWPEARRDIRYSAESADHEFDN